MYRQYEDPNKLEKRLEEARTRLDEMIARGDDPEAIQDAYDTVEDLRERVNFAWQDDEAAEMGWE